MFLLNTVGQIGGNSPVVSDTTWAQGIYYASKGWLGDNIGNIIIGIVGIFLVAFFFEMYKKNTDTKQKVGVIGTLVSFVIFSVWLLIRWKFTGDATPSEEEKEAVEKGIEFNVVRIGITLVFLGIAIASGYTAYRKQEWFSKDLEGFADDLEQEGTAEYQPRFYWPIILSFTGVLTSILIGGLWSVFIGVPLFIISMYIVALIQVPWRQLWVIWLFDEPLRIGYIWMLRSKEPKENDFTEDRERKLLIVRSAKEYLLGGLSCFLLRIDIGAFKLFLPLPLWLRFVEVEPLPFSWVTYNMKTKTILTKGYGAEGAEVDENGYDPTEAMSGARVQFDYWAWGRMSKPFTFVKLARREQRSPKALLEEKINVHITANVQGLRLHEISSEGFHNEVKIMRRVEQSSTEPKYFNVNDLAENIEAVVGWEIGEMGILDFNMPGMEKEVEDLAKKELLIKAARKQIEIEKLLGEAGAEGEAARINIMLQKVEEELRKNPKMVEVYKLIMAENLSKGSNTILMPAMDRLGDLIGAFDAKKIIGTG